jgi:hypothetical protein
LGFAACFVPKQYFKAAGDFADGINASADTMRSAVDLNHQLCSQRAQVDYLQHRLLGTNTVDGSRVPDSPPIYWADFYDRYRTKEGKGPNGVGLTWSEHCEATRVADEVVNKAIGALSAYANALKSVSGADFSGASIGSTVSDLDTLMKAIPGISTPVLDAVKGLGSASSTDPGPIGRLAGAIAQHYSAQKVNDVVHNADPAVKTIIGVLKAYLKAVDVEEKQWDEDTRLALNMIDQKLSEKYADAVAAKPVTSIEPAVASGEKLAEKSTAKGSSGKPAKEGEALRTAPPSSAPPVAPPALGDNPLNVLQFYQVAQRWTDNLDATKARVSALADALDKLGQAEQSLVDANGTDDKLAEIQSVVGLVAQILSDVAAVKSAIHPGASQ